jgi:hypothetical protein
MEPRSNLARTSLAEATYAHNIPCSVSALSDQSIVVKIVEEEMRRYAEPSSVGYHDTVAAVNHNFGITYSPPFNVRKSIG